MNGLRGDGGTGIGLVGVPGHQATADCPEPVYLVHASRHGRTIAPREFTDPLAARLWAIGLTEAGWIIRRETREAS